MLPIYASTCKFGRWCFLHSETCTNKPQSPHTSEQALLQHLHFQFCTHSKAWCRPCITHLRGRASRPACQGLQRLRGLRLLCWLRSLQMLQGLCHRGAGCHQAGVFRSILLSRSCCCWRGRSQAAGGRCACVGTSGGSCQPVGYTAPREAKSWAGLPHLAGGALLARYVTLGVRVRSSSCSRCRFGGPASCRLPGCAGWG